MNLLLLLFIVSKSDCCEFLRKHPSQLHDKVTPDKVQDIQIVWQGLLYYGHTKRLQDCKIQTKLLSMFSGGSKIFLVTLPTVNHFTQDHSLFFINR